MNSELSSLPRTWSNHVQKRYWNTSREIEIGKYNNSREEEEKSINYDIHIKFIFARISIHISLRKREISRARFPRLGEGKVTKAQERRRDVRRLLFGNGSEESRAKERTRGGMNESRVEQCRANGPFTWCIIGSDHYNRFRPRTNYTETVAIHEGPIINSNTIGGTRVSSSWFLLSCRVLFKLIGRCEIIYLR